MKNITLFNHGVFQEYLQSKLEYIEKQKSQEKDPYKKWNLVEQIILLNELFEAYKVTVDTQLNKK